MRDSSRKAVCTLQSSCPIAGCCCPPCVQHPTLYHISTQPPGLISGTLCHRDLTLRNKQQHLTPVDYKYPSHPACHLHSASTCCITSAFPRSPATNVSSTAKQRTRKVTPLRQKGYASQGECLFQSQSLKYGGRRMNSFEASLGYMASLRTTWST